MTENTPKCAQCGRTSEEVPLITLNYKDESSWICPQHLPVLIHKPQNLVGKLAGAENLSSEGHHH
jgi:hypothetical protein